MTAPASGSRCPSPIWASPVPAQHQKRSLQQAKGRHDSSSTVAAAADEDASNVSPLTDNLCDHVIAVMNRAYNLFAFFSVQCCAWSAPEV
jgi:hypothetical protein